MSSEPQKEKGTVLLVDDEEFVLKALERTLRRGPFRIITCQDPSAALDIVQAEEVDVVISDQRMPQKSGMDLLIEVRRVRPETIRILLTGYADMAVAIAGINNGKLYKFLTKPWDDEELRRVVYKAVEAARLNRRSRKLAAQMKTQEDYARAIELSHPGISKVKRDSTGAIIIEDVDNREEVE